jgi:hypothetical protein
MQSKSLVMFKILMNRFHPGVGEAYLKSLPKNEVKEIFRHHVVTDDITLMLTWPLDQIKNTHYSWLSPVFQQFPKNLQPYAIASLPDPLSSSLRRALKVSTKHIELSLPAKSFFLKMFLDHWKQQDVLPPQYLPPTPLSPLLELNKVELVELIDFLAIHDLSYAIRYIVDKNTLKAIYQCLSLKKQQFLRICLHQKEKVSAPRLEIEKWDGDAQKLEALLHHRGLFRLGKALAGQHSDFFWHITHTLDSGRGKILSKYFTVEEIPKVTPALIQQVLFLLNFLKKKSGA